MILMQLPLKFLFLRNFYFGCEEVGWP